MVSRDFRKLSRCRAERAAELIQLVPAARDPLLFFAEVARFQAQEIPSNASWGSLPALLPRLRARLSGPGTEAIRRILNGLTEETLRQRLLACWMGEETTTVASLPARILLQPVSHSSAPTTDLPKIKGGDAQGQRCSRCNHAPQAGLLRPEGHGKSLVLGCSLCLREWAGRRGCCTACGAAEKDVLEFYSAESLPGRTLQCCTRCRAYLHLIDLEEHPRAVADADEMAGLVLDVWAAEQGFFKQQPNLAGI